MGTSAEGKRLDITAELLGARSLDWIVQEVKSCVTVHLSGRYLNFLPSQLVGLLQSLSVTCKELFCFRGGENSILTEELLAEHLPTHLHTLMLWEFDCQSEDLARALRQLPKLQRLTLNLPSTKKYAALDVMAMGLAATPKLRVLQMRVVAESTQKESVISPEALALLLSSSTIQSLYLENLGLLDDHMDVVVHELSTPNKNKMLTLLDLSNNYLSEDALFSTGRLLASNECSLQALDLSGVDITSRGGWCIAHGLLQNKKLQHLELEGARHKDEFFVPVGHSTEDWMEVCNYQLRLNRAYAAHPKLDTNAASFVEALSHVSDHISCLYHFLRTYPKYSNQLRAPSRYVEPIVQTESVYDVFSLKHLNPKCMEIL